MTGRSLSQAELGALLARALDQTGIGVTITIDRDGQLWNAYANQAAADVSGYTVEQLLAMDPLDAVIQDDRPRMDQIRDQVQRSRSSPPTFETEMARPDGTTVPVEISAVVIPVDDALISVSFGRDLTVRRRIENALRESEARFRSLAEAAPDTITVMQNGRFVWANSAAAESLGFATVEEFLDRPLAELLPPEQLEMMRDRLAQVAQGHRLPPFEYKGRRQDGTISVREISSIAVDWNGRPAILAFGRDVSERHRLQAELIQVERLITIGNLAAGVAHEVNNPLTYVLLHLQQLRARLDQAVSDEASRTTMARLLDEALEGADRVRAIVRDLLSFSRTKADGPDAVDLARAVDAAIKVAQTVLSTRATVTRDYGRVPMFRGNETRLTQVFLNLIVNAAQAIGERGEITVTIRSPDPSTAVVEIADDGPGFAPDELARLFEPFYTTKPPGHGTGLGLATTRSILEGMGGRVTAENRQPHGAKMTVVLPIVSVAPAATAGSIAAAADRAERRLSVVVIDDDRLVARAIAGQLEADHDVQTFTEPEHALAVLRDTMPAPDVILCDLNMPGMSGVDLLRELGAARPDLAQRFVFITGGAVSDLVRRLTDESHIPLVHKPFETSMLRAVVEARSPDRSDIR